MTLNTNITSSVRRLFPNLTPEQAMVELLLERAQKNLIKYETMARQFHEKYGVSFAAFRKKAAAGKVSADEEQDYFDWELAVTGIDDMQAEIKRLKAMSKKA
jgi:translation initiation factor 2 alpha subunit (eIF-2alpha)